MDEQLKVLFYGYGNPGRQDDALGCLLADRVEQWAENEQIAGITCDSNYQLNIEDAHDLNEYDVVIFADASKEENIDSFLLDQVLPSLEVEFSMHSVSPGYILYLCEKMYGKKPVTGLLHIRGYEWEFQEGLTEHAQKNLDDSFGFIKQLLLNREELKNTIINTNP